MPLLWCVEAVYNYTYMHYRVEIQADATVVVCGWYAIVYTCTIELSVQAVVTVVLCGSCIQFCPRMLVMPCIVWQVEASCSQTFSFLPFCLCMIMVHMFITDAQLMQGCTTRCPATQWPASWL